MKTNKAAKFRFGKKKLPKHIRDNITHPILRQAWLIELAAATQQISAPLAY